MSTQVANTAGAGKSLPAEVQRAVARVTELGSLPEVTARILELAENPRATARQVHEVVRADPALAAKILKIVNSSFYGLPAQVASLERAIIMLGLGALRNLALATSLLRLVRIEDLGAGFQTRDLWRHCVAVGVAARQISLAGRNVQPDEAFVAGLVHDLGLIIGRQVFPGRLASVVEQCAKQPQDFCACEEAVFDTDHQAIGLALAVKWKFPLALRNVIGYHHDPAALQPEAQRLPATIYLADTLACANQIGFWLTAVRDAHPAWMLALVNLPPAELERMRLELPAQMGEAEQIFGE